MNSVEIGTDAGRIFVYNLPSNWIIRSQEDQNDFGIDFEIELKDQNGKAIGSKSIFKVQVKGQLNPKLINNNQDLSYTLSLEKTNYYLNFKIPVLLVVVDVTSEIVYWTNITNNNDIRDKAQSLHQNETIQIHIPIENQIKRKVPELTEKVISTVNRCWDHLTISNLKSSILSHPPMDLDDINDRIRNIGDALFTTYHIKLGTLLLQRNFTEIFKESSNLIASTLIPEKDRFIATLYYEIAFSLDPFTAVHREQLRVKFDICATLIYLSRKQRSKTHRLVSIGKSRKHIFQEILEQLHSTIQATNNFDKKSIEYFLFNQGIHEHYNKCCVIFQKIVHLCARSITSNQYSIFANLIADFAPLIFLFKDIHKSRATPESIEFLDSWFKSAIEIAVLFFSIEKNIERIERLYRAYFYFNIESPKLTIRLRSIITDHITGIEDHLDKLEQHMREISKPTNFIDEPIEEQKKHFERTAKSLGFDPKDPNSREGKFVKIALDNYDPTEILMNCRHLFVHYRPAGIIASSLQLHSAGMPLLICLKHNYASGTGGLLSHLYDSDISDFPLDGFKQSYCSKCGDCQPRESDWSWNLRWYYEEVKIHQHTLNKFGSF